MYPGVKGVKEVEDGLAHCRTNKFLSAASPTAECMPEFFLYKDACHQSCPSHFYADRRHCVPCHEDCLECSGPSADDCDLCADTSLVLYDGQCLDECPERTYLEKETQVCKGKDFRVCGQAPRPREPMRMMGFCWEKAGLGFAQFQPQSCSLSTIHALVYYLFLNESFLSFVI